MNRTRNRIPRRRDGRRVWGLLDTNERVVLAAVYRQPNRTADELRAATGLSRGRLGSTLRALMSPQRCAPLGVPSVLSRSCEGGEPSRYSVSPAWAESRRVPQAA